MAGKDDSPNGRVQWIKPLDGGTLYPTLNRDYPVVQYYQSYNVVRFPAHAIARTFMSPRTEILKEGWGMAPPEKIIMAVEMLNRGDKYYANLLLDVPPAGILDLGDISKDDALEWVKAFKSWSQGNLDSFSIPVLYEHTSDAKFLPFGKAPNDLMYDRITLKYAAITCAGYGMSLGDVGLQATSSSGETLAGSIRSERKTKRTGFARAKKKIKYFFDSILPDVLEFKFIDLDDELNVSLGRARLADSTAAQILIQNGIFDAAEMRLQFLEDGVISINVPEEPPVAPPPQQAGKNPDRPGLMGYPQNATAGGQGEVKLSTISVKKSKAFDKHVIAFVGDITDKIKSIFEDSVRGVSDDSLYLIRSNVSNSLFDENDALGLSAAVESAWKGKNWLRFAFGDVNKELSTVVENYILEETDDIETVKNKLHSVDFDELGDKFIDGISTSVKDFIGKSAIYILKDMLLIEDVLDDNISVDYDSIVELASNRLIEHFDEFVSACVNLEAENLIQKVKNEVMKND